MSWFEVHAVFDVRADDQDAATNVISDAVRDADTPGLFPVGTFSARPTDDPVQRARRNHGLPQIAIDDHVTHTESGWAGDVIAVDGDRITVRPTHPRPKQVLVEGEGFVDTPDDWAGWAPITVTAGELEKS